MESRLLQGSVLGDFEYEALLSGQYRQSVRFISPISIETSCFLSANNARSLGIRSFILFEDVSKSPPLKPATQSVEPLAFDKNSLSPSSWIVKSSAQSESGKVPDCQHYAVAHPSDSCPLQFEVIRVQRVFQSDETAVSFIKTVHYYLSDDRHRWIVVKLERRLNLEANLSVVEIGDASDEVNGTWLVDTVVVDNQDGLQVIAFRSSEVVLETESIPASNGRLIWDRRPGIPSATAHLRCRYSHSDSYTSLSYVHWRSVQPPALYHVTLTSHSDAPAASSSTRDSSNDSLPLCITSSLDHVSIQVFVRHPVPLTLSVIQMEQKSVGLPRCHGSFPSPHIISDNVQDRGRQDYAWGTSGEIPPARATTAPFPFAVSVIPTTSAPRQKVATADHGKSGSTIQQKNWDALCASISEEHFSENNHPPGLEQTPELPKSFLAARSSYPPTENIRTTTAMPLCHGATVGSHGSNPLAVPRASSTETKLCERPRGPMLRDPSSRHQLQPQSLRSGSRASTSSVQMSVQPNARTNPAGNIQTANTGHQWLPTSSSDTGPSVSSLASRQEEAAFGNTLIYALGLQALQVSDPGLVKRAIDSLAGYLDDVADTAAHYLGFFLDCESARIKALKAYLRIDLRDNVYASLMEAEDYFYFVPIRMTPAISEHIHLQADVDERHLSMVLSYLFRELKKICTKWRFNIKKSRAEEIPENLRRTFCSLSDKVSLSNGNGGDCRPKSNRPASMENTDGSFQPYSSNRDVDTVRAGGSSSIEGSTLSTECEQLEGKSVEEIVLLSTERLGNDRMLLKNFLSCCMEEYGRLSVIRLLRTIKNERQSVAQTSAQHSTLKADPAKVPTPRSGQNAETLRSRCEHSSSSTDPYYDSGFPHRCREGPSTTVQRFGGADPRSCHRDEFDDCTPSSFLREFEKMGTRSGPKWTTVNESDFRIPCTKETAEEQKITRFKERVGNFIEEFGFRSVFPEANRAGMQTFAHTGTAYNRVLDMAVKEWTRVLESSCDFSKPNRIDLLYSCKVLFWSNRGLKMCEEHGVEETIFSILAKIRGLIVAHFDTAVTLERFKGICNSLVAAVVTENINIGAECVF